MRLRALFDNHDESLFPAQSIGVRLRLGVDEVLVSPEAAVQYGRQGTFVYAVVDPARLRDAGGARDLGRCRRGRRACHRSAAERGAARPVNLSRPFILRPVATMLAMLSSGVFAWRVLPVAALPQVDSPIIQVVALYPGASPSVTASAITASLERQLGRIPASTRCRRPARAAHR